MTERPSPTVLLYRRRLDARSGAGQLIGMQADGLRAHGVRVQLACRRGAFKYWLRTGRRARSLSPAGLESIGGGAIVVDHELELQRPDIVFVHGLATAARQFLDRENLGRAAEREADYFGRLPADVPIVANSGLMRSALVEHFGLSAARVDVVHPGYRSQRFFPGQLTKCRPLARRRLGIPSDVPVAGFVTSGDLELRGLDTFLAIASEVARALPDAHFAVVGAHGLPRWARSHPLVAGGRLHYRPKDGRPWQWIAALDLYVHAGRFEAFGMTAAEALALGVPLLTSRRIGLAELLPQTYQPWLVEQPDAARLAPLAVSLLADSGARERLRQAGLDVASGLGETAYGGASMRAILGARR